MRSIQARKNKYLCNSNPVKIFYIKIRYIWKFHPKRAEYQLKLKAMG